MGGVAPPLGFVKSEIERGSCQNGHGIDGQDRGDLLPVWLAPRARSGTDPGPIRATAFRTPRHQSLPVVRRLDDTVVRPRSELPASGARVETHRAIRRRIPPQTASAKIAAQAEGPGTRVPRGRRCSCRIFNRLYHSLCILRSRRAPSWPVAHGLSLCPSVASDRGAISARLLPFFGVFRR
jgi:hypothetical protein